MTDVVEALGGQKMSVPLNYYLLVLGNELDILFLHVFPYMYFLTHCVFFDMNSLKTCKLCNIIASDFGIQIIFLIKCP